MKKNSVVSTAIFIFIAFFNLSSANADDKQMLRNKYESINQRAQEGIPHRNARSTTTWPSGHPASAATEEFHWFDDKFNIYLWRGDDNTPWVEIDPINSSVFICSPSFDIFQNGEFQVMEDILSIVSLEMPNGESYCDDVSEKTVFKLTTWSSMDDKTDIYQPFVLYFSSNGFASRDLSIRFNENTAPPLQPSQVW